MPLIEGLAIETLSLGATGATVRVTFKNYGQAHVRTIHFTKEGGEWVIEEAMLDVPEAKSLSAILAGK